MFSDLLVWGWLRRLHVERQITRALASLDRPGSAGENVGERTKFLEQLAVALDAQDPYLNGHSRRVARYATGTAGRLGLSGEDVTLIQTAAILHDVGKLRIPAQVLQKPGRLTDAEFAIIKRHPDEGAAMVATLGDPRLTEIVRHHHERFDGSGYPSGLTGREIPLGSRIIATADTFDAITSARPYRAASPHKRALDVLHKEACTQQIDAGAAQAFIAYYSDKDISVLWSVVSPPSGLIRTLRASMAAALTAMVATAAVVASVPSGVTADHAHHRASTSSVASVLGSYGSGVNALGRAMGGLSHVSGAHGAPRRHAGQTGQPHNSTSSVSPQPPASISPTLVTGVGAPIAPSPASGVNGLIGSSLTGTHAPLTGPRLSVHHE